MKNMLILILVVVFASCEQESENSTLPGRYKIVSIESGTAVDLNNDGTKSTDLYLEISEPFKTLSGENISFYDFNAIQNLAEVKGVASDGTSGLIDFRLPKQQISNLSDDDWFLMWYDHGMINCSYSNKRNNLSVDYYHGGFDEGVTLHNVEILSNSNVSLSITQKLFDFSEKVWIEADLVIEYQKIN